MIDGKWEISRNFKKKKIVIIKKKSSLDMIRNLFMIIFVFFVRKY